MDIDIADKMHARELERRRARYAEKAKNRKWMDRRADLARAWRRARKLKQANG